MNTQLASCTHIFQRTQPGVTYSGVAGVFECPWCKCDALAAEVAKLRAEHKQFVEWAEPQCKDYVEMRDRIAALEAALRNIITAWHSPDTFDINVIKMASDALAPTESPKR